VLAPGKADGQVRALGERDCAVHRGCRFLSVGLGGEQGAVSLPIVIIWCTGLARGYVARRRGEGIGRGPGGLDGVIATMSTNYVDIT